MKATRTYTMTTRADRTAATRERIARAAAEMYLEEPFEDVTLARIAAAAGVSHQTVLNHFESKEGVVLAAAEVVGRETLDIRSQAEPGDVPGAVRALVRDYERIGDANVRWAMAAERVPDLVRAMDDARAAHQGWLVEVFGDQLPPAGSARTRAVHALHAATDVYVWKLLRRDLHLSRAATERTMADLVVGVLERSTP